jgi:hypothetical protein
MEHLSTVRRDTATQKQNSPVPSARCRSADASWQVAAKEGVRLAHRRVGELLAYLCSRLLPVFPQQNRKMYRDGAYHESVPAMLLALRIVLSGLTMLSLTLFL